MVFAVGIPRLQAGEDVNMNSEIVPVFAGNIAGVSVQLVDARLLHGFMEVGKHYASWIVERISEYGFVQDQDFLISQNRETKLGRGGDRRSKEYHITALKNLHKSAHSRLKLCGSLAVLFLLRGGSFHAALANRARAFLSTD